MIIQLLLIAGLTLIGVYALTQRRRSGPISFLIIVAVVAGIVLVAAPDLSTIAAHAMGIGRGVDLVFYVFMFIMFAAVVNIHLRLRANAEVVTLLARELALSTARQPKSSGPKD